MESPAARFENLSTEDKCKVLKKITDVHMDKINDILVAYNGIVIDHNHVGSSISALELFNDELVSRVTVIEKKQAEQDIQLKKKPQAQKAKKKQEEVKLAENFQVFQDEVTREFRELKKKTDSLDRRDDSLQEIIMSFNDKVDSLEKRLDERMQSLEKRLDERMQSLEKRLDGRIDVLDGRMQSLELKFDQYFNQLLNAIYSNRA